MSLDVLRQNALKSKRHDLTARRRGLRSQKLALRQVSNLIAKNANLATLLSDLKDENSPPPDSEESTWLNSHDVADSRYFDDSSIPFPTIPQDDDSIYASKSNRPSTKSPGQVQETINADAPVHDGAIPTLDDPSSNAGPVTTTPALISTSTQSTNDDSEAATPTYAQRASEQPDGPTAFPDEIAPPQPEEQAEFSGKTKRLLDLERPEKPAKVVHLPPEDVQEERLHEGRETRNRKTEDTEQGKASQTHLQTQAELASSPSSTVGAYSAATPLPPQDSPDTSPDSESSEQLEVLPPRDMRPSPQEQREIEEHDRLLEAQKEIARRQALGDVSTADDQLRWEEREAAARDAEERAAREDGKGPEPDAKNSSEETEAEEVMQGVEREKVSEQVESASSTPGSKAGSRQPPFQERPTSEDMQEDGDNITVTPRNKLSMSINITGVQQASADAHHEPTPGEQDRMRTRTSSGALQKRSVSDILGQTPTSASRRVLMSPEEISPTAIRGHYDAPASGPSTAAPVQTPLRSTRMPVHPRTPGDLESAMDLLAPLKGAADDSDRDYLEPLFRIQAHDMPQNIHTTALPDLIRSASKALSTDDHFTSLHERLEYRIMRRIYQLQNANKWSFRQMEKCNEIDQPVTHHDHMMVEMQWMRKDFKAERKMKKNVCAWLARRCAEWVAASADERKEMQVHVQLPKQGLVEEDEEQLPELEQSGEPTPEEPSPPTPEDVVALPSNLVIPPDLLDTVSGLQKDGKLGRALGSLPVRGLSDLAMKKSQKPPLNEVSKLVTSKILPKAPRPLRKRSRYEYDDDADLLESQPDSKRLREERDLNPEDIEIALFNPENKHIRDRLHANNAFRPPSEFVMPSTQFYEFRNGSQWLWEDDLKLRKLAKEYCFNWSLIADELQLPGFFKSSAERRTPWECFERWVELEQLPTEMKKTIYFKTWYQRLEQSQQAAERRYQAQVAALQAHSHGQATHVPMRRKITPARVEKRKNSRYLWMVDAFRKGARKRESTAYKQAEAQRAALQRKSHSDDSQSQKKLLTPQEMSKMRYEKDLEHQENQRRQMQQAMEMQRQRMQAARLAHQQQQQGVQNGNANQQRPGSSSNVPAQQAQMQPNGQQQGNALNLNGPLPQQARGQVPMATRNGHLAVPQISAQGMPQAQMRPNGQVPTPQDLQRIAHAQAQAQARNVQYGGQQYQMPNANMMSSGNGGMTAQQHMQNNQAMLASMQQQMNNANHQGSQQAGGMSQSPSMPPPPTPQNHPQQLSSGHVPALLNIKAQIRAKWPQSTEEQVNAMATEMLKSQSQSTNQARQSAMNAAAGINGGVGPQSHGGNMQAYGHNQAAFQNNQIPSGTSFMSNDAGNQQAANMSPTSPQQYAALMRHRQLAQMRMQQSPNATHATLNGSPSLAHASPNMAPVSPNVTYANMSHNQMAAAMNMGGINAQQQRPPSRSATPQMQRLSGSPQTGLQGSPRNVQASMAR